MSLVIILGAHHVSFDFRQLTKEKRIILESTFQFQVYQASKSKYFLSAMSR